MFDYLDPELVAGALLGVVLACFWKTRAGRVACVVVGAFVVLHFVTGGVPGLIWLTETFLNRNVVGQGAFWVGTAVGAASVIAVSEEASMDQS